MRSPFHLQDFEADQLRVELRFLRELSTVVARHAEMQPILDWIVTRTAHLLEAEECCIKRLGEGCTTLESVVSVARPGTTGTSARPWPYAVRGSLTGYLIRHGPVLSTRDLLSDPRFPGFHGMDLPVRSLLAVPLRVDKRVTGLLAVSDSAPGRSWSKQEVDLLTIVAGHSAAVIEKAQLRLEAEQKKKMLAELEVAREIQMHLIPNGPLLLPPWRLEGRILPARQLGGDYFDFFRLRDGRAAVVIADVMGKSVPAALVVASVHAAVRAIADGERPPAEVVGRLNHQVVHHKARDEFVTLFYGELDPARGRLQFVNAGHNYPLLRRAGGALEPLVEGGTPLGMTEDVLYRQGTVDLGPRDALLLFSDGIVEAMNPSGDMFGDERLEALWKSADGEPPGDFLERLLVEVEVFRGGREQLDDMTAVVVGRCAPAEPAA